MTSTFSKTLFILEMSKRAPFKYPKWKLSSQMDSDTLEFFCIYIIPEFRNSEFLMKLKFPSCVTREF